MFCLLCKHAACCCAVLLLAQLGGKSPDLVKKVATQDLTDTAATYDTAAGVASMTFTRPLSASSDTIAVTPAGPINFIWSHGVCALTQTRNLVFMLSQFDVQLGYRAPFTQVRCRCCCC
jgi:hypothetical protein